MIFFPKTSLIFYNYLFKYFPDKFIFNVNKRFWNNIQVKILEVDLMPMIFLRQNVFSSLSVV